MSQSGLDDHRTARPPTGRSLIAPHRVRHAFLDDDSVAELLDIAAAHEADFMPTRVVGAGVAPQVRRSREISRLGEAGRALNAQLIALVPTLVAELGVNPIRNPKINYSLVAHGDGDFFARHMDTLTDARRDQMPTAEAGRLLLLSAVYYFHRRPKAFTGGALRIHAIGDPRTASHLDVEPEHNSLVVFPSWAPHEVLPVACLSGRFIDGRFSINCLVYGDR